MSQPEAGARLSLLTVNLWNGRACAKALGEVLARWQPDLLAAQELSHDAADVIAAHFPHVCLRPRTDTFGMGMASRMPVEFRPLPMPRRTFLIARCPPPGDSASGSPIEVINVHLSCPQGPTFLRERAIQVGRLLRLDRQTPGRRVLAGDFNTAWPMPAYWQLRSRFSDAAQLVGRQALRPTWGPTARSPRLLRIDHVLVSRVGAERVRRVPVAGSDHDGVLATLCV